MLCLSEETLLIRPLFLIFLLACYLWDFELNTLTIVYSSSDQSKSSAKAQGPIYNFGLLSLQYIFLIYKLINVAASCYTYIELIICFMLYVHRTYIELIILAQASTSYIMYISNLLLKLAAVLLFASTTFK